MALYALAYPSPDCSGEIRYVGTTKAGIDVRAGGHFKAAAAGVRRPVYDWIRKLWGAGLMPEVCDMGPGSGPDEVALIAALRKSGARLLNCTDGGDGCVNPSTETRAKISATGLGRIRSPETQAKISAARKGYIHSPETRARMSEAKKGRIYSPEHRAKISAAKKGRTQTPEHRANLSAARKGRIRSPETRAKMSAAAMGRIFTPEHRANISAARKRTIQRVSDPSPIAAKTPTEGAALTR